MILGRLDFIILLIVDVTRKSTIIISNLNPNGMANALNQIKCYVFLYESIVCIYKFNWIEFELDCPN